MFADLDLSACARVVPCADYPRGLVAAAATAPDAPWLYTGGLENHPAIVRRIAQSRLLWGNGADVIAKIRNPWRVAGELVERGLPALHVWPRGNSPPDDDGRWMQKPVRGAAGRGIAVWDRIRAAGKALRESHYFQEHRGGVPLSALYLGLPGRTMLLGVTRQLIGLSEVHAPPFAWCGTIAPASVPAQTQATIVQIGEALGAWAGLRGLFGCDFLLEAGVPWLTEVNPRYPASTELVEHLLRVPLLEWHRRACQSLVASPSGGCSGRPPEGGTTSVIGKIILYARRNATAPDFSRFISRPTSWMTDGDGTNDTLPYLADIPVAGTRIIAGQPICTLFASARNDEECLAKLVRRAARIETRFV
ncbi:MAG: ATP-grasp domain-containing protein [Planctomycetia bacterium]|nr:ATP-grasp domain-containing protein [Planctomycetia bacterium]